MTARRQARLFTGAAGLILASLSAAAFAQKLGQGGSTDISIWRVLGALLLCLALAVGGALALKKRLRPGASILSGDRRRLEFVESLRLSHQVDLCLVRCDGREFMIATSPHGADFAPDALHAAPAETQL